MLLRIVSSQMRNVLENVICGILCWSICSIQMDAGSLIDVVWDDLIIIQRSHAKARQNLIVCTVNTYSNKRLLTFDLSLAELRQIRPNRNSHCSSTVGWRMQILSWFWSSCRLAPAAWSRWISLPRRQPPHNLNLSSQCKQEKSCQIMMMSIWYSKVYFLV